MAADQEEKSSKTEEPTERKLRKARDKGDVPSSKETGTAMTVLSLFLLCIFLMPQVAGGLARSLALLLDQAGQIEIGTGGQGLADVDRVSRDLLGQVGRVLAPLFLVMILGALFGVAIQGETVVSAERIKPKPSKISPASGLKKMFSADTLVEFLKSVVKVIIVAVITVVVVRGAVTGLWQAERFVPETLPDLLRTTLARMLLATVILLVPVALADILWKRFNWKKKQRMSLKEIRDEHKESEGDPQMKARRAEQRRQRARQRIATAVPTASVVLTNPTHYAVALRYEPGVDTAPVCVAKGQDRMAARIRELARDNEVPVVENKPLARALHASVEVEDTVPVEHWQAVAEIIGYVMDLRRNIRRAPPSGSSLRED